MSAETSFDIVAAMQEAIIALRFVKPEFDHTLAIFCEHNQGRTPREIGRKIRAYGEQISVAEKRSLGIPPYANLSRLSHDMLTERGLADPIHSIDATVGRALLTEARAARIARARLERTPSLKLGISAAFRDCPGCSRLGGCALPLSARLALPPADCDREVCALFVEPRIERLEAVS